MSKIKLEEYSIEQLIELNKKIVERVKYLQKKRQIDAASQFSLFDIVSFMDNEKNTQEGIIIQIKAKKIKIVSAKDLSQWTVSPSILTFIRKGTQADLLKIGQNTKNIIIDPKYYTSSNL